MARRRIVVFMFVITYEKVSFEEWAVCIVRKVSRGWTLSKQHSFYYDNYRQLQYGRLQ
jgi:hypothetical protein